MSDMDHKNKNLIKNAFKKLFLALKSNNEDEFTDIQEDVVDRATFTKISIIIMWSIKVYLIFKQ